MPAIMLRDPTLVERLRNMQKVPSDYFDDVIYELLRKAEAAGKPKLSGLDNLPQLVAQEVMRALDGKLTEAIKSALLPAVSGLDIEIPVQLSIKVRLRLEPILEPVFDVSPVSPASNSSSSDVIAKPTNNVDGRATELDELERRAIQLIRENGGCWEGSAYSLVRLITGGDIDWALEKRLRRRLKRLDGKLCLPEAVAQS